MANIISRADWAACNDCRHDDKRKGCMVPIADWNYFFDDEEVVLICESWEKEDY